MSISVKEKCLSYVRGFKVPKKLDIENALGKFDNNSMNSIFNEDFCSTFDSLPLPKKESDWLAQYAEKGQTYTEFIQLSRTLHTPSSSHRKSIYLTLFGEIDKTIVDIDSLIDYTQRFFQMEVKLIEPFINFQWNDDKHQWICQMSLNNGKIRDFNIRTRYNEKSKHSQMCVTSILNLLKKVVPDDGRCVVALTMFDLYGDDTDLFLAGLSMGNCRVAAFSLYRYDPYLTFNHSNWFDCKLKNVNKSNIQIVERQNLLLLRSCRLLTHEICHLLGISHCIFYSCLLNGSGHLDEDFSQPLLECPIDLRKLYTLIQFNIQQRYEQLLQFFKIHNFLDEIKIVEIKVNLIKQSMSNLTLTTTTGKRKRTQKIKTKKDVLTTTLTEDEDEEVSQPLGKHLKCN